MYVTQEMIQFFRNDQIYNTVTWETTVEILYWGIFMTVRIRTRRKTLSNNVTFCTTATTCKIWVGLFIIALMKLHIPVQLLTVLLKTCVYILTDRTVREVSPKGFGEESFVAWSQLCLWIKEEKWLFMAILWKKIFKLAGDFFSGVFKAWIRRNIHLPKYANFELGLHNNNHNKRMKDM